MSDQNTSMPPLPTKAAFIESLESHEAAEGDDCSICHEPKNTEGHMSVTAPCNHTFGRGCLLTWFKTSDTCPMCRQKLFAVPTRPSIQDRVSELRLRESDLRASVFRLLEFFEGHRGETEEARAYNDLAIATLDMTQEALTATRRTLQETQADLDATGDSMSNATEDQNRRLEAQMAGIRSRAGDVSQPPADVTLDATQVTRRAAEEALPNATEDTRNILERILDTLSNDVAGEAYQNTTTWR